MDVVIPFDAADPKTRLAPALEETERLGFARAMLRDVLGVVRTAGHEPTVLATDRPGVDAPVRVDERPLSSAVNAALADRDGPVAVVMADLPLVTVDALARLTAPATAVVLAPGLGGGTNAVLARDPAFRVDYHGGSYRVHRECAAERGLAVTHVDSFRLALDVDEPRDIAEVLLHGDGDSHAVRWLREAGFELTGGKRGLDTRRDDA